MITSTITCRRARCLCAAFTLVASLVLLPWSQAQSAAISITWQPTDRQITLHEPVVLTLLAENHSSAVATLDLGANFIQGLLVTIVRPDGTVLPIPPFDPENEVSRIGRVRIGPGLSYVHNFLIDEWYAFESPGAYTIRVSLRFPIIVGGLSLAPPGESSQAIYIGARDEAALRRRCEALADRAVNPKAGEDVDAGNDALDATTALTYVRDTIAVPYLIKSLSSEVGVAQARAALALGKFSTPDAVEALIPIANGSSQEAPAIRRMLLKTAQSAQDPELRKHIYTSLGEPIGK